MNPREKLVFRYLAALDRGDFDIVSAVLKQAESDPELERMLVEVGDTLYTDGGPDMNATIVNRSQPQQLPLTLVVVLLVSLLFVTLIMVNPPDPGSPGAALQPEATEETAAVIAPPFTVLVVEGVIGRNPTIPDASSADTIALIYTPLIVRDAPDDGAAEIVQLVDGDIFTVLAYSNNGRSIWAEIALADGRSGYVNATYANVPVLGPVTLLPFVTATPIPMLPTPIPSATALPSPTAVPVVIDMGRLCLVRVSVAETTLRSEPDGSPGSTVTMDAPLQVVAREIVNDVTWYEAVAPFANRAVSGWIQASEVLWITGEDCEW